MSFLSYFLSYRKLYQFTNKQDRRGIKKKFYAKYTFAKHCNLVVLRKAELRIACIFYKTY